MFTGSILCCIRIEKVVGELFLASFYGVTSLRSRGGKFQLVKGCQQIDVNVYWQHFMLCLVLRRMEVDCWCVKV